MVSILTSPVIWILLVFLLLIWVRARRENCPKEPEAYSIPSDPGLDALRTAFSGEGPDSVAQMLLDVQFPNDEIGAKSDNDKLVTCLTLLSSFFVPLSLVTSFGGIGVFGTTEFMSWQDWTVRLPFFIPKSSTAITELDQVVPAVVGTIALIFSLWHAFQSQRKQEEKVAETRKRREAAREIFRQRVDLARLLRQLCLLQLRLLQDELGQTRDDVERRKLLLARNTLILKMSEILGS